MSAISVHQTLMAAHLESAPTRRSPAGLGLLQPSHGATLTRNYAVGHGEPDVLVSHCVTGVEHHADSSIQNLRHTVARAS